MSNDIPVLRLQDAWRECERHIYYLCRALAQLDPIMPMTGEIFGHLSDEQVQSIDQFILRFTKLQDAMGGHLFSSILQYLQEQYEERPMIDKLNRLEKLRYIHSAERWQNIRNTRNKFAHDYPDDNEKNAALINVASESAKEMSSILANLEKKLNNDYPTLNLGKPLSIAQPKQWG